MLTSFLFMLLSVPAATVAPGAPGAPGAPVTGAPDPGAPVASQDEEFPDKRDDIKELLSQLAGHIKERGSQDTEAIAVIDKLLTAFPECGKKDRAAIVKGLGKCFTVKRKQIEEGVFDNKLFIAAAAALGEMAPESPKVLITWVDDKRHRKDTVLQRRIILSMGKTQHESCLKTLKDLLNHSKPALVGAAAEALGEYKEYESKVRKDLFESMLKVLMAAKGNADENYNDLIAQDRWDVISAPLITSLQLVSGEEIRKPEEWQRWWNKNKRRSWDEPE